MNSHVGIAHNPDKHENNKQLNSWYGRRPWSRRKLQPEKKNKTVNIYCFIIFLNLKSFSLSPRLKRNPSALVNFVRVAYWRSGVRFGTRSFLLGRFIFTVKIARLFVTLLDVYWTNTIDEKSPRALDIAEEILEIKNRLGGRTAPGNPPSE